MSVPEHPVALKGRFTVIAFFGAAGTGKSMRAQAVAAEHNIDIIIDDGLLISRGRIVAGRSAKAEKNMVRAIRRAIFYFPDHREEVRRYLEGHSPARIMVLATSRGMYEEICTALGLPQPDLEIKIEDVSSDEDIQRALEDRKLKKRHVIPVSQAQIRKNFTGRLVGHLRSLWASKEEDEKTIVRPPFSYYGSLKIEPNAIRQVIEYAVISTNQIVKINDLKIREEEEKGLIVSMSLVVKLEGMSIRELTNKIALRTRVAVEQLIGVEIIKIDINIDEVRLDD